jgi:GNAT superfamily N-acetyltransferase
MQPRTSILTLEDAKGRSSLSIEPSSLEDGSVRLFKELSGTDFKPDAPTVERLAAFLDDAGVREVIFEDTRKAVLTKLLRKIGFHLVRTYDAPKGVKVRWRPWNEPTPADMRYFGVGTTGQVSLGPGNRRLALSDRQGAVGEIVFTDHGRFVRARANRFGSDGFGLVRPGADPSSLLVSLVREMAKEKKRYIILGQEYSDVSKPIHPFPLWHMVLSSPEESPHGCRPAVDADRAILVKLASQYEDTDIHAAWERVEKNLQNQSFRYILPPGSEGFALLRFMEAAEGMINDLYVPPEHQGKGIGDELTRGSISVLSKSCINVHLNTIYPRARRLYEKYGFSVQYEDLCVALNQRTMSR